MDVARGLTHAGRHLVNELLRLHDDGRQWANRYELARRADVSPRTALRVLSHLEALQALEVQSVRGQQYGINTPTLYRLTPTAAESMAEAVVSV